MAPQAEDTPPPGCVDEPHMYKFPDRAFGIARNPERPVKQQLIDGQLALEDISLGQTDLLLHLMWRSDFHVYDEIFEARAVPFDFVDDGPAELVPFLRVHGPSASFGGQY